MQRTRPWRTYSHFVDVGGSVLSSGMSYLAVFAVFASLWVGFGVFGIWLRDHTKLLNTLVDEINRVVPGLIGDKGLVSIDTLLDPRTVDLASIIAGASLLFVVISWFTGTRRGIRLIFGLDVKQYRNAVMLKLRDLLLALLFSVILLTSAIFTIISSNLTSMLVHWLGGSDDNWLLGGLGLTLRYAVMYIFDVLVLIAIHRWLAEIRAPRLDMLLGCALGGAALFILKLAAVSVFDSATKNPLLIPFALIIGLLIWFNLICRTLLLTASWIATGLDWRLGMPEQLQTLSDLEISAAETEAIARTLEPPQARPKPRR